MLFWVAYPRWSQELPIQTGKRCSIRVNLEAISYKQLSDRDGTVGHIKQSKTQGRLVTVFMLIDECEAVELSSPVTKLHPH